MIPKHIEIYLKNNHFKLEFDMDCAIYRKYYKTMLFGDVEVDILDKSGLKPKINIVKDYEAIISHDLNKENIEMCIKEIDKLN